MFGDFFSKITDTLEAIDEQAASQSRSKGNIDISDEYDDRKQQYEIENALLQNQKYKVQLSSLEQQIKRYTSENAKLHAEIEETGIKISDMQENLFSLQNQNRELQTKVENLQNKLSDITDKNKNTRNSLEAAKTKLEKELSTITEQNYTMQHELQLKNNENQKLNEKLEAQQREIESLESYLTKYRSQAIEKLTSADQNSAFANQIEMLESDRNRLSENLSRSQQRISQLENSAKEVEAQMLAEFKDLQEKKTETDRNLFKEKAQNEALRHEVEMLRSQILSSAETCESKYKLIIENMRNEQKSEIAKIREEQSKSTSKNIEQQLIQANLTIDSLKSEKAAILLMMESKQKENYMNFEIPTTDFRNKSKSKTIVSMLPENAPSQVKKAAKYADMIASKTKYIFNYHHIVSFLLIVWILIIHLHWIYSVIFS